jgi:hypothetical protein
MPKVLPFPARRVRRTAAYLLRLTASPRSTNKPPAPANRPGPPEALGNMLQRLVDKRPATVLVLENIVAEMLKQLEA